MRLDAHIACVAMPRLTHMYSACIPPVHVYSILLIIIIVQAALLSLRLDPSAPPLVGARFSIQMFAMVLLALRSESTSTFGKGELLWIDIFYIFQFATMFVALTETVIVHSLGRAGRTSLMYLVDGAFRWIIPYVSYPLCMAGLLLWAMLDDEVGFGGGITLFIMGLILPLAGGLLRVARRRRRLARDRARLAHALVDIDVDALNDSAGVPLLREAFALFDYDGSGEIEDAEIQILFDSMYPHAPRAVRREALQAITHRNGHLTSDEFDEAVMTWRALMGKRGGQAQKGSPCSAIRLNGVISKGGRIARACYRMPSKLREESHVSATSDALRDSKDDQLCSSAGISDLKSWDGSDDLQPSDGSVVGSTSRAARV